MSFVLTVDGKAFNKHIDKFADSIAKSGAALLPVIKGNGYGFTRTLLCEVSKEHKFSRIAVGTIFEAESALQSFDGEVLVLEPVNAHDEVAYSLWKSVLRTDRKRLIATISSSDVVKLSELDLDRIVIEGQTSVRRFGLSRDAMIHQVKEIQAIGSVIGFSLHSPIADPQISHVALLEAGTDAARATKRVQEVIAWALSFEQIAEQFDIPFELHISHLSTKDIEAIRHAVPAMNLTLRSGTQLWLGAPDALQVTGTVLEIQEFEAGAHEHVGYRQVDSHGHKRMLIVSGGTSHGVALAAPTAATSLRRRGIHIAEGVMNAIGKVRSPFTHRGQNLPFAEPPHMQVSLVWTDDTSMRVGDQLACNVRNTTAHFDAVIGLDS